LQRHDKLREFIRTNHGPEVTLKGATLGRKATLEREKAMSKNKILKEKKLRASLKSRTAKLAENRRSESRDPLLYTSLIRRIE